VSKVIKLQAASWEREVSKAEEPVVIDFWHQMCGWCIKLNPVFDQLPERFKSVKFAKMNVLESTENRSLAMGNGVMGTPTIKVFCEGRDIGEIIGFRTMEDLENDLREILEKGEDCLGKSTPLES
jgi:thioredoxin 1